MADRLFLRGKTWWCWGYDIDGRRWQESTKQREKRAAELAAREITRRYAASPDRVRAQKVTVDRALSSLLDALERKGRTPATLRAATYHCRHLITHMDRDKPLGDVELSDTTAYLDKRMAEGASRHTVAKELRTLTQAWKRLAKLKTLPPCPELVPDELGTVYTPRDRWLPGPEFAALRAELKPSRREYLDAYCFTGVRLAELYSYERDRDLDEKRSELHVRGTKTDEADRVIPLSPAALAVFKRHERFPVWHTIGRDLKRACKRAKIRPVSPNDLRRTFCSWLCQQGVPERVCADLLGHADTTMVRAVYGHLDRDTLAAAVAKLPSPVAEGVATKATKRRAAQKKAAGKKAAKRGKSAKKNGTPGKI